MRILIIGGTRFVGRHITDAALAADHDVALLHRGCSGADLFPQATHVTADRDADLGVLRGTRWDATIDVSAYRPGQVTALAEALEGNAGHYILISSVSVYDTPARPGYTEDSPLLRFPPGAAPQEETDETYGPLKVLCEEAAQAHFGPGALVVRPTFVIGPHDHIGRFTYWVRRIARGGEVLAPGHPDRAIQLIDARDHAAFIVNGLATGLGGVFHAVGPSMPFSQMLEEIAAVAAPADTQLTWVDPQFLLDEGETGETLPLWYAGDDNEALFNTASPDAAIAAGLTNRPLAETVKDVLTEQVTDQGFLTPERETELLTRWTG